jgi:hypothetical protein
LCCNYDVSPFLLPSSDGSLKEASKFSLWPKSVTSYFDVSQASKVLGKKSNYNILGSMKILKSNFAAHKYHVAGHSCIHFHTCSQSLLLCYGNSEQCEAVLPHVSLNCLSFRLFQKIFAKLA